MRFQILSGTGAEGVLRLSGPMMHDHGFGGIDLVNADINRYQELVFCTFKDSISDLIGASESLGCRLPEP